MKKKSIGIFLMVLTIIVITVVSAYWIYIEVIIERTGEFNLSDYRKEIESNENNGYFKNRYVGQINSADEARREAKTLWLEIVTSEKVERWEPLGVAYDKMSGVWMVTNNYFLPHKNTGKALILIRASDGKVLGWLDEMLPLD